MADRLPLKMARYCQFLIERYSAVLLKEAETFIVVVIGHEGVGKGKDADRHR